MKKLALSFAALAIAAVPFVASAGEEDATIDGSAAGQGTYYVDVETSGIYEETNRAPGLQTQDVTDENGRITPKDVRVA